MTRLVPAATGIPIPLAASPPLAACAAGGGLHVFGREEARGGVVHVLINRNGQPLRAVSEVPLAFVSAATAGGGEVAVTGSDQPGVPAIAVVAAQDGAVRWSAPVPTDGPLVTWPVPADDRGRKLLVYVTGPASGPGSLHVAEAVGGSVEVLGVLKLDGPTDGLAVAATPPGLTVLRAARAPDRIELLRVVDGGPERRSELFGERAVAPSLAPLPAPPPAPPAPAPATSADAAVPQGAAPPHESPSGAGGGGVVAAWIAPARHDLRAQPFGADLAPLAPASPLVAAGDAGRPQSARLLPGPPGRYAITWRRLLQDHRGRVEVEQFAAAYDPPGGLGEPFALPGAGMYEGGGWIGETLLVLHGSSAPLLSVFSVREAPGGDSASLPISMR